MQVGSSFEPPSRASGHFQKDVPKLRRSRVPNPRLVLSSHHGGHALPSRGFVPVLGQDDRVKALLRRSPDQVGKIAPNGVEPCSLPCQVPVVALVDATGPAYAVGRDPSPRTWRRGDSKRLPCMGIHRVFQDSATSANRCQRRREASAVITQLELVRLPWRPVPESSPSLARRVGNNWKFSVVLASIARLRPWIDARNGVATSFLDKQCSDYFRLMVLV